MGISRFFNLNRKSAAKRLYFEFHSVLGRQICGVGIPVKYFEEESSDGFLTFRITSVPSNALNHPVFKNFNEFKIEVRGIWKRPETLSLSTQIALILRDKDGHGSETQDKIVDYFDGIRGLRNIQRGGWQNAWEIYRDSINEIRYEGVPKDSNRYITRMNYFTNQNGSILHLAYFNRLASFVRHEVNKDMSEYYWNLNE